MSRLETRFVTDVIYEVVADGSCLCLQETVLASPLTKSYPLVPPPDNPHAAFVATIDDRVVGYTEVLVESWNRRANVRHLYVSEGHRRQGAGKALLGALAKAAKAGGARGLWIETQNVNYPAIQFYKRQGFRLSGWDRSLYDPVSTPGEIGLFFSRDL